MFSLNELKYSLRVLLKNPGFSSVAVVTLALGIGLNVTVFSILNAFLFKPLPAEHAADLVWLTGTAPGGDRFRVVAYPDVVDFRGAASAVCAMSPRSPKPAWRSAPAGSPCARRARSSPATS